MSLPRIRSLYGREEYIRTLIKDAVYAWNRIYNELPNREAFNFHNRAVRWINDYILTEEIKEYSPDDARLLALVFMLYYLEALLLLESYKYISIPPEFQKIVSQPSMFFFEKLKISAKKFFRNNSDLIISRLSEETKKDFIKYLFEQEETEPTAIGMAETEIEETAPDISDILGTKEATEFEGGAELFKPETEEELVRAGKETEMKFPTLSEIINPVSLLLDSLLNDTQYILDVLSTCENFSLSDKKLALISLVKSAFVQILEHLRKIKEEKDVLFVISAQAEDFINKVKPIIRSVKNYINTNLIKYDIIQMLVDHFKENEKILEQLSLYDLCSEDKYKNNLKKLAEIKEKIIKDYSENKDVSSDISELEKFLDIGYKFYYHFTKEIPTEQIRNKNIFEKIFKQSFGTEVELILANKVEDLFNYFDKIAASLEVPAEILKGAYILFHIGFFPQFSDFLIYVLQEDIFDRQYEIIDSLANEFKNLRLIDIGRTFSEKALRNIKDLIDKIKDSTIKSYFKDLATLLISTSRKEIKEKLPEIIFNILEEIKDDGEIKLDTEYSFEIGTYTGKTNNLWFLIVLSFAEGSVHPTILEEEILPLIWLFRVGLINGYSFAGEMKIGKKAAISAGRGITKEAISSALQEAIGALNLPSIFGTNLEKIFGSSDIPKIIDNILSQRIIGFDVSEIRKAYKDIFKTTAKAIQKYIPPLLVKYFEFIFKKGNLIEDLPDYFKKENISNLIQKLDEVVYIIGLLLIPTCLTGKTVTKIKEKFKSIFSFLPTETIKKILIVGFLLPIVFGPLFLLWKNLGFEAARAEIAKKIKEKVEEKQASDLHKAYIGNLVPAKRRKK